MRLYLGLLYVVLSPLCIAGGWVSSGDDGVICFPPKNPKTPEYIKLINEDYRLKGYLSVKTKELILPEIEELSTLEFWETREDVWNHETQDKPPKSENKDRDPNLPYNMGIYIFAEDTEGYLKNLEEDLLQYAPLFHILYKEFSKKIHFGNLNFENELPKVDDSRPRYDLNKFPNCTLVQLAIRKTEDKHGLPNDLDVSIDPDLFAKLRDDLNRALVISHERLYAISFALGIRNSDSVRLLNAELFRSRHWIEAVMNHSLPQASLRIIDWLQFTIGDFYRLIPELPSYKASSSKNSIETKRLDAFLRLRKKQNDLFLNCIEYQSNKNPKSNALSFKTLKLCRTFGDDPVRVAPLNEEESFIFLTQPKHMDHLIMIDLNSLTLNINEHLLDFEKQNTDIDGHGLFKDYCGRIKNSREGYLKNISKNKNPAKHLVALRDIFNNAARYCQMHKD